MQELAGAVYKTFEGLTYYRIHDAGHMVPRDQPKASLEMFEAFLYDKWV